MAQKIIRGIGEISERYNYPKGGLFLDGILYHETRKEEPEDGGDVRQGTIDLGFGRTPFVVEEVGVAGTEFGLGTHTLLRATGGVMAFILKQFVGIDARELVLGELLVALEAVAQSTRQGVALHLPELGHLDAGGVKLEGSTHRREETRLGLCGQQDEQCLVLQRVDGIDDIVVLVEVETVGGLFGKDLLKGSDLCRGVDSKESILERLHLDLTDGLGSSHQLTVDIGDAHAVGIDNGELTNARAHQTLGTPRTDASHAKEDDTFLGNALHSLIAQQQFGTAKYSFFDRHKVRKY